MFENQTPLSLLIQYNIPMDQVDEVIEQFCQKFNNLNKASGKHNEHNFFEKYDNVYR